MPQEIKPEEKNMWIWAMQVWDKNTFAAGLIDQRIHLNKENSWFEKFPERYGEFYVGIVVQKNVEEKFEAYAIVWDGGYGKTLGNIGKIKTLRAKEPEIVLTYSIEQRPTIPDSFINTTTREWLWEEIPEEKIPNHTKKIFGRMLEKMSCLYSNGSQMFTFVSAEEKQGKKKKQKK